MGSNPNKSQKALKKQQKNENVLVTKSLPKELTGSNNAQGRRKSAVAEEFAQDARLKNNCIL